MRAATARAGVVLDVDGTTVDTETIWDTVEEQTVCKFGGRPAPRFIAGLRGKSLTETAARIKKRCAVPDLPINEIVKDLQSRFKEAVEKDGAFPVPGMLELLRLLRIRSIPTAAVSNTSRPLVELVLRRAQVDEFFDTIICAGDDPDLRPKPEPDLYRAAAERLNIDPRLSWGIEDSRTGLTALRAAGFLPVALGLTSLPDTGLTLVCRSLVNFPIHDTLAMAAARTDTRS